MAVALTLQRPTHRSAPHRRPATFTVQPEAFPEDDSVSIGDRSEAPDTAVGKPPPGRDYIYNPDFAHLTDDEVFGTDAALVSIEIDASLAKARHLKAMPVHLLRMCEAKLLTPQQEWQLFRRMNFAKYRAAQLGLSLRRAKRGSSMGLSVQAMQQQATAARNLLVQANLRLVISIAKRFANRLNPFEDLLSEGIEALLRAVDKFDYDRGFRFSTYATQAIHRTLYRTIMHRHTDRAKFVAAGTTVLEDRPQENTSGTMTEDRWHQLQSTLVKLLGRLDDREQWIIRQRFGLDQRREVMTLQSLAEQLGVCKERVRQLEQRAIAKLRQMADEVELSSLSE